MALAIAVGETAPLLFTAGFSNKAPPGQLTHSPVGYLTYLVYTFFNVPKASAHALAADAAVVLLVLVLFLIVIARAPRGHDPALLARPATTGRAGPDVIGTAMVGSVDGRIRILVVEDEESYREALQAGLGKEGFAVELAADGLEGLRLFAARPPDLVLLDVMLPGLSGTEVCRRMRALAPVPVIMVSALDAEVDIVLGLELGAADYVTKPYRFRELVARIQAVLRRVQPPAVPGPSRPLAAAVAHRPRWWWPDRCGSTSPAARSGPPAASSTCRVASSISSRCCCPRRPGPDPRRADRPSVVGSGPDRHPDPRHPHPPPPGEARARPGRSPVPGHRARRRFPFRRRRQRRPRLRRLTVRRRGSAPARCAGPSTPRPAGRSPPRRSRRP